MVFKHDLAPEWLIILDVHGPEEPSFDLHRRVWPPVVDVLRPLRLGHHCRRRFAWTGKIIFCFFS